MRTSFIPTNGKHPGVLIWPDIFGLRPAFRKMGKRLAESGYSVLVVNPFYRTKKAPVAAEGASFQDPTVRAALMQLAGTLNKDTAETDAKTFIAWLDKQSSVDKKRKMGTMGYCMGGPLTMRTAAAIPDRVGAGASFHGGGLVTDKPDSPHLLVPKMKASYLFAIAANDDEKQPEAKNVLRETSRKRNCRPRSRCTRERCTAGARRTRRSTTKRRRRRPGADCSQYLEGSGLTITNSGKDCSYSCRNFQFCTWVRPPLQ